ncbi:solute carrier family 35 member G1 [Hydra vulgaris]|uniref:Solute carrier family 35 member G1 n=1 Tax=Hydra vulgaris TaxID=6087 RepID=A0ABM4BDH0_HYDVU
MHSFVNTMQDKKILFLQWVKNFRLIGMLLAALSGLSFTISNFMVQMTLNSLPRTRIPTLQFVFARCAVQTLFIIPTIIALKVNYAIKMNEIPIFSLMGFAGYANIVFMYSALDKIPIADTLAITFTSPLFCCLLSHLILKEGLHWFHAICGLLSFGGVLLVAHPTFLFGQETKSKTVLFQGKHLSRSTKEVIYFQGIAYAFISGMCLALYFVLTRYITRNESPLLAIAYPSIFGVIVSPLIMLLKQEGFILADSIVTNFYLFLIGFMSLLALLFLTLALRLENATIVNVIRNVDIVYAFVMQFVFLCVKPTKWTIGGSLAIMAGTSLLVLHKWHSSRKEDGIRKSESKETEEHK